MQWRPDEGKSVHCGAGSSGASNRDNFTDYDWAARQMIEFTRRDAAYGVMMMGYAEDVFAQLRRLLTETSTRAQEQRTRPPTTCLPVSNGCA